MQPRNSLRGRCMCDQRNTKPSQKWTLWKELDTNLTKGNVSQLNIDSNWKCPLNFMMCHVYNRHAVKMTKNEMNTIIITVNEHQKYHEVAIYCTLVLWHPAKTPTICKKCLPCNIVWTKVGHYCRDICSLAWPDPTLSGWGLAMRE